MKRIRFYSSFCDEQNVKNVYKRLSKMPLYDIEYIFVSENETHAIILNTATPPLNIPKENVIGLAFEPPAFLGLTEHFKAYAKKHIGQYFIGVENLPAPFTGHYAYMWHITPLTYVPQKTNLMSIMVSQKQSAPGHKYRHTLCKEILKTALPIDIWGRGCRFYQGDSRIKGEFTGIEPYESYKFHIAIENYETEHYMSEKITNALYCNTTPVYLGAKKVDLYFGDMVIKLTGDIREDMQILIDIVKDPIPREIDLEEVKRVTSIERCITAFH